MKPRQIIHNEFIIREQRPLFISDLPSAEWIKLVDRLLVIAVAAQGLHERVEMDESVGVCLTDRVPSLRLGEALATISTEGAT